MSFSTWLLPCFFEGGGTSKNANADEEDGGAEKTTCREGRKNVLCSSFQRVVFAVSTCCVCGFNVLPLFLFHQGQEEEASGTASLFFFLWFFQIL